MEDNLRCKGTLDQTQPTRTHTQSYHYAIKQRAENEATELVFDTEEPIIVN